MTTVTSKVITTGTATEHYNITHNTEDVTREDLPSGKNKCDK